MPLRIVFMGTPGIAAESLQALMRCQDFQVTGVITQPDQPKGRGLKLQPSPVKELALSAGLPVFQPDRARDPGFFKELEHLAPELIAVTAYGQILPQAILDLPRFGCLNVHTSLLPRYRGAAPIQWAILNGDSETGVTIMKMDAGMDTGPILAQESISISANETAETLHDRLAASGAALLVKTIPKYLSGEIVPRPQSTDGVSYAPKIRKQDGRIDWHRSARVILNRIHGLAPWPGAFTWLPDRNQTTPQRLKVWEARITNDAAPPGTILRADKQGILVACGSGALLLTAVQVEGGRRMTAQEFLSGHPLPIGERLGTLQAP